MNVIRMELPDVLLIEPKLFGDQRGFFFESFNARVFTEKTGVTAGFVQDNHSRSKKGVLRGLHYQIRQTQGKLLRVVVGEVFDVAVDIRRSSKTFGRAVWATLSAENKRTIWVPAGFAHGFLVTSASADVLYKTTDYHAPEHERAIRWDDPELNIPWPLGGQTPMVSAKDAKAVALRDAEVFD